MTVAGRIACLRAAVGSGCCVDDRMIEVSTAALPGLLRGDTVHDGMRLAASKADLTGGAGMTPGGLPEPETSDELVEFVAREIQLRGLTGPAVMFLESSRTYGPLGGQAMLFFDPVLRSLFGGDLAEAQRVLADDDGIERLIERLEEVDEDQVLDA